MARNNKSRVAKATIRSGAGARAARGVGKARVQRARQAATPPGEPAGLRYAKYGLAALTSFAVQMLLDADAQTRVAPPGRVPPGRRPSAGLLGSSTPKSSKSGLAGTAIKTGIASRVANSAGKAALQTGKTQAKLLQQAIQSQESPGVRFAKYGLFALLGFAGGALLTRLGGGGSSGGGGTSSDSTGANGQRGETWGSGTSTGAAGGEFSPGPAAPPHQRPGDTPRTGAERDYSNPSSGPLIGEQHGAGVSDIPEQQEDVEQRIRGRVGQDPRTLGLSRLNVEVNDGVAEIRGTAPTQAAKDAVGEVAAGVEGVREVRNLLVLS